MGDGKKYINLFQNVNVSDFLESYSHFFRLTKKKDPELNTPYCFDLKEDLSVIDAIEARVYFADLVFIDLPETIENWCKAHPVRLETRAANLQAIDQLGEFTQLLREFSNEFKEWYYAVFRKSYIEKEEEVQKERFKLKYEDIIKKKGIPEGVEDCEDLDNLIEQDALVELEKLLLNRLAGIKKKLKRGQKVWPRDLSWWIYSKDISSLRERYKYLESMLVALEEGRLSFDKSFDLHAKYRIEQPADGKIWAIIDPRRINSIPDQVGMAKKTFEKYRAALIKCEILKKVYKVQEGPALIAIGTYNNTTRLQRPSRFLQKKTMGRLFNFNI